MIKYLINSNRENVEKKCHTLNSVVIGQIWPRFELTQAFTHVPITRKYKKMDLKNNQEKVETTFSAL